MRNALSL